MGVPGVPLFFALAHHGAVLRAQRQSVWRARPPVAGEGRPVALLLQAAIMASTASREGTSTVTAKPEGWRA